MYLQSHLNKQMMISSFTLTFGSTHKDRIVILLELQRKQPIEVAKELEYDHKWLAVTKNSIGVALNYFNTAKTPKKAKTTAYLKA